MPHLIPRSAQAGWRGGIRGFARQPSAPEKNGREMLRAGMLHRVASETERVKEPSLAYPYIPARVHRPYAIKRPYKLSVLMAGCFGNSDFAFCFLCS